ncbi:MAG TPA: hypothetical protein VM554_14130 [Acidisarcina sp.]|nr:hypothetical protein [Acidisarcina sp.]
MLHQFQQIAFCLALAAGASFTLSAQEMEDHAGHVPLLSGGMGYVHSVNGGVTSLEPQIDPVLVVPFGRHVLLESRVDFTGFFQHQNRTYGTFKGKVFKTIEFAQFDWLMNSYVIVTAGRYLLPFGLYNERLQPIWIKDLQDAPITATIGTRPTGAGDGLMLRGVAVQMPSYTVQYTAYFSAPSNIEQLVSGRAAGGDGSLYWPKPRVEAGVSYQRVLQNHQINSVATYVSWQPKAIHLDLKAEYDYSYNGNGYWLETSYLFEGPTIPSFLRHIQVVGRMQQVVPLHGGGNSLPRTNTQRTDVGINYYLRDDIRIVSSYGRSFSVSRNINVWNVGLTYRFSLPLWREGER